LPRLVNLALELTHRQIPVTRNTLAAWLNIHPKGRRFETELMALKRSDALADADRPGELWIPGVHVGTQRAVSALEHLTPQQHRVLALIDQGHKTMPAIAGALGIHPKGRRFETAVMHLRDMGIVTAQPFHWHGLLPAELTAAYTIEEEARLHEYH
jgi:hypothetical protein